MISLTYIKRFLIHDQRVAAINVSGGKEPPDICIMELGGTGKMPSIQVRDSNRDTSG